MKSNPRGDSVRMWNGRRGTENERLRLDAYYDDFLPTNSVGRSVRSAPRRSAQNSARTGHRQHQRARANNTHPSSSFRRFSFRSSCPPFSAGGAQETPAKPSNRPRPQSRRNLPARSVCLLPLHDGIPYTFYIVYFFCFVYLFLIIIIIIVRCLGSYRVR